MSKTIKIKKGYNLKLVGEAQPTVGKTLASETYALKPTDFHDIVPKLLLREGANVKAGDSIYMDKDRPDIKFPAPVSGEITEVRRGEKRKILEIVILADKEIQYKDFGSADPNSLSGDDVKAKMLDAGAWPLLIERPFGVVANPAHSPKHIFVTGINSAPLAADVNQIVAGEEKNFQTGLDALAKLTEGKVYLSLDGDNKPAEALTGAKNVEVVYFKGPHPKGNVGVQIHQISPLNKGEHAFTLNVSDVIIIGRLFNTGKLDLTRKVAVVGSEVKEPQYYSLISGANLKNLFADQVSTEHNRYISGNVLTGTQIEKDGYLGFYSTELSVIKEGDEPEFLGWILPGFDKFSLSRTFWSWLMPNRKYKLDTAMHGEERAFVMTGIFEDVFPFDIYPVQLIKSIMVQDIEKMEQLGIYEVIEEDFALCEVVDPSKIPVQEIVREGLNFLRKEVG